MHLFHSKKNSFALVALFLCISFIISSISLSAVVSARGWNWSRNRASRTQPLAPVPVSTTVPAPTPVATTPVLTTPTATIAPIPAPLTTPAPTGSEIFGLYGYYPSWAQYGFPISQVSMSKFDGILHAFVYPDSNGRLVIPSDYVYPLLTQTTKSNGKLSFISVGGAINSDGFKKIITNSTVRSTFVNSLVQFVRANGYDGVDLDWEYPNGTQEALAFAALADAIRQAIPGVIITTAMPIAPTHVGVDIVALQKSFDKIFVMAYDVEGGWDGYAGYNAPLYKNAQMPADTSIANFIQTEYLAKGVLKEKLVLGLALYARKFNVASPYMRATASDTIEYKDLPFSSCSKQFDQASMVPFLSCNGSYISYDDSVSIAAKVNYAKSMGLAGVFFWALGQDNNQIVNTTDTTK